MDEGRRNFLAYQIISGIKFITIDNVRYKLIAPSKELKLFAEHIYQDTIESLRFDNFITKEKAGKASKAIGEELPLYSDYAKQHKEDSVDIDSLEELPEDFQEMSNEETLDYLGIGGSN